MRKIAVWTTLRHAFAFAWTQRRDLAALATLPIIVLAFGAAFTGLERPAGEGEVAVTYRALVLLQFVLGTVLYTMFAVAWHRKFLVPGEVSTVGATLKWGRRQTRFLGWMLAFGAVMSIPSLLAITSAAPGVNGQEVSAWSFFISLATVALLPAYGRVLPIFPALAIDHKLSLQDCWNLTVGNGWRLLWLSVLPFLPAVMLQVAIIGVLDAFARTTALDGSLSLTFVGALLQQTISYSGIAIAVSALSKAYTDLIAGGA